jgi:ubiquinone biosynthesis protein
VRPLQAIWRSLCLLAITVAHGLRWLVVWLFLLLGFQGLARRQAWFARCFVDLLRDLGATYVKLGQIMSTRPDLLPPYVIAELARLQDNVGPFAFAHVRRTFVEDFGSIPETLFAEFSPVPIASASVAQVHRARLHDGRLVAVKVRRPALPRLVRFDLGVVRLAARMVALVPSWRLLGPRESAEEFARAIWQQLDFRLEAANNRRFRAQFTGDPDIGFPELHEALCSERVLTMNFVEGKKMLPHHGTPEEAARLARTGFRALLRMIFEFGFVHADLHPGNILVQPGGHITLIDLGMVGELDDRHRQAFARFFALWAAGDGKAMARLMIDLAPPGTEPRDAEAFCEALHGFIVQYLGKRLGEVSVGKVVLEILSLLRTHRVRVNPAFTICNIAIAVTEGIGRQLDPSLDLMQEAVPFFMKMGVGVQPPPAS